MNNKYLLNKLYDDFNYNSNYFSLYLLGMNN